MQRYSVKIQKVVTYKDEIFIDAIDKEDAERRAANLCFRDDYAGSLVPRKLFRSPKDKEEKMEIISITKCVYPEENPIAPVKPHVSISIE